MQEKRKIYYVAELNLPSKSAYSIHVMKMCEAFSKLKYDINLFVINKKNINQINKIYNIDYKFKIFSIFNNFILLNFMLRIIFSIKILSKKFEDDALFLSRSIVFSLLACVFKKKIILELHHEITGFSKIIYVLFKKLYLIDDLKFIFLNKNLNQIYKIRKENYLILDDAVSLKDFNYKKKLIHKKTCIYIGSFFEGKGIEQILRLAKKNRKIFFHIYGEKKYYKSKKREENVKVFDYVNYSKIPQILSKYQVALMPYQNKVKGRGSILIQKYMSPLKMFDYLAAKMIIVASNLKVYRHILKNNFNCLLVKTNDDKKWSNAIESALQIKTINRHLKINAYETAKKYTWDKRCQNILYFMNKNKLL
tara:strand:+ start:7331 stop:8425 length:1095 start_codon:yes stop_codon:yes gene_type:complete